jgi:hypothetical protein
MAGQRAIAELFGVFAGVREVVSARFACFTGLFEIVAIVNGLIAAISRCFAKT